MKKRIIFLCVLSILFTANLCADTISLKSGKDIEAKILERKEDRITIDFYGVEVTYFLSDVDAINGEKIAAPVKAEAVPMESPQPASNELKPISPEQLSEQGLKEEAVVKPQVQPEFSYAPDKAVEIPNEPTSQPAPPPGPAYNYGAKVGPETSPGIMSAQPFFSAAVILALVFVFLLFYAYSAICLQIIAKKTNNEPAWLAWVPIGNLFLMCKIAQINYLWLLLGLLMFVPLLNILIGAASAFIWYKIAIARGRPGWVGILTLVPLLGLGVPAYLAFIDNNVTEAESTGKPVDSAAVLARGMEPRASGGPPRPTGTSPSQTPEA